LFKDVSIFISNNRRKIYELFAIDRALKSWLDEIKQLSWPELMGQEGTYAVEYIKEKTGKSLFNL
jgi:hypothetical protein